MDTIKSDQVIEGALAQGNLELCKAFDADVIFLKSPMRPGVDDAVKDEVEELRELNKKKATRLVVILETTGGSVETVERLATVFRRHYKLVEFVVPNYAYSAGTILVLSGDEIHLDYYSILGPIDPQIDINGSYLPGMGYLAKFEELARKINASPDPAATRAEMAFLINKFDPAILFLIEQSVEHSKELLRQWLPKYKFKSWKVKEKSGAPVTKKDREDRADQIATVLGNAEKWHSHGRGITMQELMSDGIKLKVRNYADDPQLYGNISHYHGLLVDYMGKIRMSAALHTRRGIRRLR